MRLRSFLGLAAVLAIAIGSIAGALVVRSHEHRAFERRQREEAVRAARQAESLARLSVGQLSSATAFYQAVEHLTRHKFEVMAGSLLRTGVLNGTGLVLAVPAASRARYEQRRGFPIVDRSALGFRRSGRRPVYYPLTFADSTSGLEPPLGFDLGSDPRRSPYMLRAGASGKSTATPAMHLPIGGVGINVFRPVYRDGAPTATRAQRLAALVGFAVGAFHVPALTTAATAALPDEVGLQLDEGGRSIFGAGLERDGGEGARVPLRIADRSWLLVVHDPNSPDLGLPLMIAVFGISMAALLGALILVWSRNERMQELRQQASQDPLTGLGNRRRFEEDLRTEIARCRREGGEGALLMLDLDNFKQVNDTLGHPVGDRVIAEIAGVLQGRMRITDVVARLGGDEFAVVLPRSNALEARGVAEAIAAAVRGHAPREEGLPPITISIGIGMFNGNPELSAAALMEEADAALYEAKRGGRDAVRIAGDGVPA
jgi:diguanylate cyclase (GGDEF)-like protein